VRGERERDEKREWKKESGKKEVRTKIKKR